MFDEGEFLEVARHLRSEDDREGFQRSAISRAYYAVFLSARQICRQKGWINQSGRGSDHRTIAEILGDLDRNLGRDFEELQRFRRDADYAARHHDRDQIARDAQLAIDMALSIRREMERLA